MRGSQPRNLHGRRWVFGKYFDKVSRAVPDVDRQAPHSHLRKEEDKD